jgi:cytochrome c oxidase subunit IV
MAEHPVTGSDGDAPAGEVVPSATEQVHLPGPSYLPVVVAAGVTLALVGVVVSLVLTVLGVLVTLVGIVRWTRETREEIAELPLEH